MQLKMVIGANRRTRKWKDRRKLLFNDGWDMKPGL